MSTVEAAPVLEITAFYLRCYLLPVNCVLSLYLQGISLGHQAFAMVTITAHFKLLHSDFGCLMFRNITPEFGAEIKKTKQTKAEGRTFAH